MNGNLQWEVKKRELRDTKQQPLGVIFHLLNIAMYVFEI